MTELKLGEENIVQKLKLGDGHELSVDNQIIIYVATLYYGDLMKYKGCDKILDLLDVFPSLVGEDTNETLLSPPSDEETKVMVFSINTNSAPGPDGQTEIFLSTSMKHCQLRYMQSSEIFI